MADMPLPDNETPISPTDIRRELNTSATVFSEMTRYTNLDESDVLPRLQATPEALGFGNAWQTIFVREAERRRSIQALEGYLARMAPARSPKPAETRAMRHHLQSLRRERIEVQTMLFAIQQHRQSRSEQLLSAFLAAKTQIEKDLAPIRDDIHELDAWYRSRVEEGREASVGARYGFVTSDYGTERRYLIEKEAGLEGELRALGRRYVELIW